ncbi:MAG: hypothetical protein IKQ31_04605 [Clostridia bacterium]|nr:hypothetical protein [Clostridia bacterium]
MSDNTSSSSSSAEEIERIIMPVWELLFDMPKEGEKVFMELEKLINRKVKVWNVLATTVGGVHGTWKGQVGILTSFDDEFIVLDNDCFLSRKFIFRIEPV